MSPSLEKRQCPFCLGHRRVKTDGTFCRHDWGRSGRKKLCPGSGLTLDQAREQKRGGAVRPAGNETRPEDIF